MQIIRNQFIINNTIDAKFILIESTRKKLTNHHIIALMNKAKERHTENSLSKMNEISEN
jgi:hypothetical protein